MGKMKIVQKQCPVHKIDQILCWCRHVGNMGKQECNDCKESIKKWNENKRKESEYQQL
jgi:hypothetical protein